MRPLPYVWPHALVFWSVFVWAYIPEFRIVIRARRSVRLPHSPDAGSCRVITVGTWIAFTVAFPLAWVRPLQFGPPARLPVFVVGTLVLVLGSLLRRHCWRMLGPLFTGDVQAEARQQVVSRGAYAYVRHPAYTAGILMHAGVGLALGNWGSALVLVGISLAVYSYRMTVEERALLAAIGEPYREFMRTRKRLIPYVY
jgi:protein-S-isoprenylcysteine O-methyltransferase Ste14